MSIIQYPYKLQVLSNCGSIQNGNGDWIPNAGSWVDYCNCRDEAGNGKEVTTTDGKAHVYSALIQMPKGIPAIESETPVRVTDSDGSIRVTGSVVYSRKDQMHTRTWV